MKFQSNWESKYDKRIAKYAEIEKGYKGKLFSILAEILKPLGGKDDGERILFGHYIFKEQRVKFRTNDKKKL